MRAYKAKLNAINDDKLTASEREQKLQELDTEFKHWKSPERIAYEDAYADATAAFLKDLRKKHENIPEAIFDMAYARAYETHHSYGYDAVADEMEGLITLMVNIRDALIKEGIKD